MELKELNVGNYVYAESSHDFFEIEKIFSMDYNSYEGYGKVDLVGRYLGKPNPYESMYNCLLSDMSPIKLDQKVLGMVGFTEEFMNGY